MNSRIYTQNPITKSLRVARGLMAALLGLCLMLSSVARASTNSPNAIIEKGIAYLMSAQNANGSWNAFGYPPAETSVAVLALLNAGYPLSNPAVSNALQFLTNSVSADGRVVQGYYNYSTAMVLLPLCAAYKISPENSRQDLGELIRKMRDWLISSQMFENGILGTSTTNSYNYGAWGYGSYGGGDMSNTQWALMGINAADQALGLTATDTYARALAYLDYHQNTNGWTGYSDYTVSHNMTSASVWSRSLCGLDPSNPRVALGLKWLADNYTLNNVDGFTTRVKYYYLVTFAKAMVMSHKTLLGTNDWYQDMTDKLANEQNSDGSWYYYGDLDGGRVIETAWSIMCLQTRVLPANLNGSMAIILHSHADLHVYDPEGRHVGVLYTDPRTLEVAITNATFQLTDQNGAAQAFPTNGIIPTNWTQTITVPLLLAGAYRIELVGTSDGPYEATVIGSQNGISVASNSYSGTIVTGQQLSTSATATALEGALTMLFESLKALPVLNVSPSQLTINPEPVTLQSATFVVREVTGTTNLHSVSIHATDIVGTTRTISGAAISFSTNNFDVPAGGEVSVTVYVPIPSGFVPTATPASIVVESSDGGTRSIALNLGLGPSVSSLTPSSGQHLGGATKISVSASGSGTLAYQWLKDGQAITDRGLVSGTHSSELSLGGVANTDGYTVVITDQNGSVTSDVVNVTVEMPATVKFTAGTFNGLFYPPEGVGATNAGSFTLSVTAKGQFSGQVRFGSLPVSFSGQFDSTGHARITKKSLLWKPIVRIASLTLDLQVDTTPGAERIVGTVSDGTYSAGLFTYLAGKSAQAPARGQKLYTLAMNGSADAAAAPAGWSVFTANLSSQGRLNLSGTLADGTKVTESQLTSIYGDFPLFSPLAEGSGLLIGWLHFTNNTPGGDSVIWLKSKAPRQKLYPNGFTIITNVIGSLYQRAAAKANALALPGNAGTLQLQAGNLASTISTNVALANNKISLAAKSLTLTINPASGVVTGSFVDAGKRRTVIGVALQNQVEALGSFQGSTQTGAFSLMPTD